MNSTMLKLNDPRLLMDRCYEHGAVGINTGLIATEVGPFGGVKKSGIGSEGSRHWTEEFVEIKYMLVAGLDQ